MPDNKQEEYKRIFFQESDELLQQMNQGLLALEKNTSDDKALNSIFRAAHTIKGMAGSMGYREITDLSHKMEDVLSQMRSKSIDVSSGSIDIVFKSFDALEAMIGALESGSEYKGDVASLISQLDSIALKKVQFKEEQVSEGLILNVFEKRTLLRVKKDGYNCFEVWVTLEKSCVLKGVRAFMVFRNLHAIGEVIRSFPDTQSLTEEKFAQKFGCVFITKDSAKLVKEKALEVLEIESVEVREIEVNEAWEQEVEARLAVDEESHAIDAANSTEQMRKIRSVRVDIERLDKLMNLVEELAISKLRLVNVGTRISDPDLKSVAAVLGRLTDDLQAIVMQTRMVPVSQIFDRFPRLVRDLAKREGKLVRFEILGGDIELDRTVLDEIGDPLIHLLRNSVDHGIEEPAVREKNGKAPEGNVVLSAKRERGYVMIEVSDDGAGMDVEEICRVALEKRIVVPAELAEMNHEEKLMLTARPGFSTSEKVTDVSGRGVGLDVVKQKVEGLGGNISFETAVGKGMKLCMRIPITTAVLKALLVKVLGNTFALPISSVVEIVVVPRSEIRKVESQETIIYRDRVIPVIRLGGVFGRGEHGDLEEVKQLSVVVVEYGTKQFGIIVQKLVSQQDIVVKQLGREFKGTKGIAGATILGDGAVALVLDAATLV